MEYEDFNPWQTTIRKYSISEEVCFELINEYATIEIQKDDSLTGDIYGRIDDDKSPRINEILSDQITPKVLEYIREHFHPNCRIKEVNPFFQHLTNTVSDGVAAHDHAGSHVVATLYLNNPSGAVSFLDPRMSCRRGYPEKLLQTYFGKLELLPKNGDLNIFPSFLWHEGGLITRANRMVMIVDYWIDVH